MLQQRFGMDEEIVVYLCGNISQEHTVWYRVVLETSTVLSKGEKRDREGHQIVGLTSSPIAEMHENNIRSGGGWAVIGDDIYYAGGWCWKNWEVEIDKNLFKHNIHHNDSSYWETVTSLTIPRIHSFLAPVGRKLAIVSGTTTPLCPPTQEVCHGIWRNCGEVYDLDTQSLDYLTSPIHLFYPYQSLSLTVCTTTVLEDPKQVVFYDLDKGTLLIVDASNGVIIENKTTTPDPCFALQAESFMDDPPQGLQGCEESIALLRVAASNSRAVFHRRTFYWFTYEMMLYVYDMDQRQWFRSECLQQKLHPLKLKHFRKIRDTPLLIGLPNENFLVILFPKKVKPIMASLSVEKKLNSTTLDVNVKHIQHFHPHPRFSPFEDGIAIRLKNTGSDTMQG